MFILIRSGCQLTRLEKKKNAKWTKLIKKDQNGTTLGRKRIIIGQKGPKILALTIKLNKFVQQRHLAPSF